MIKYLTKKIKISYHKMKISHNFRDSVYPTRKNDLILDLVRCFDFNVAAYAKYTAVKKNIFFSQTFLAYHKYNAN